MKCYVIIRKATIGIPGILFGKESIFECGDGLKLAVSVRGKYGQNQFNDHLL